MTAPAVSLEDFRRLVDRVKRLEDLEPTVNDHEDRLDNHDLDFDAVRVKQADAETNIRRIGGELTATAMSQERIEKGIAEIQSLIRLLLPKAET